MKSTNYHLGLPLSGIFPELRTPRLRLRPFVEADAEDLFRFRSDPEVQRYNGGPMTELAEAHELLERINSGIKNGTRMEWAVTLNDDHRVFGYFGFSNWNKEHRRSEVGYSMARDHWGRGFAFEAMHAIIEFGFGSMNLNRIYANAWVANSTSTRLLERLGFSLEARFRQEYWFENAFHDEVVYALLKGDYDKQKSPS